MVKNTAIVTGAAGFAGANLVEHLVADGYKVIAIVRPGSRHNDRLKVLGEQVTLVDLDSADYDKLPDLIGNQVGSIFFHLAWGGGRDAYDEQMSNIFSTLAAVKSAAVIGCKRFVCTGSQAEYGAKNQADAKNLTSEIDLIRESDTLNPFNSYGADKAAAMILSKDLCRQLEIEWVWGRIFSLYGKYEPRGRMYPDMLRKMLAGEAVSLSSCRQYWDYLDAGDAADAIIALGERGKSGEIYNIANGDYRPLREFIQKMVELTNSQSEITFGADPSPFVSLNPSVDKICADTGWRAKFSFEEGTRAAIERLDRK